ncbi:hypothetical protein DVK04_01645 [Haloferax sp. Atlit-105R]|nr:hypothetical protein DVK04_01645 [Haloferax sp. Atlit-105R]
MIASGLVTWVLLISKETKVETYKTLTSYNKQTRQANSVMSGSTPILQMIMDMKSQYKSNYMVMVT